MQILLALAPGSTNESTESGQSRAMRVLHRNPPMFEGLGTGTPYTVHTTLHRQQPPPDKRFRGRFLDLSIDTALCCDKSFLQENNSNGSGSAGTGR